MAADTDHVYFGILPRQLHFPHLKAFLRYFARKHIAGAGTRSFCDTRYNSDFATFAGS